MIIVISLMVCGIILGYAFKERNLKFVQKLINYAIFLLLFLLGITVGANGDVMNNLDSIGLEALLITLAAIAGSVLCAWGVYRFFFHVHEIIPSMKGSIIIVSFFIAGVLIGKFVNVPSLLTAEEPTLYALYALMFFVGISIGSDKKALEALKHQNFKIILVPLATIIGTLAGSALISVILSGKSLTDCLAVGSGFGYYSLSTIFITQYKGAELGTIALVSNILRELIALLAAPLLVRYFGKLAPISVGGATTADTTLPIITKFCGKEFVIISIVHGILVDLSVPFLVTFFCTI